MVELKNVKKSYLTKRNIPVVALLGINITFQDKGFIVILGKSGSGKSTLLNIIGGLDRYNQGDIIINNNSTSAFNGNQWDSYRNTFIGFVFQEFNLIDRLTIGQNIGLALELQGYAEKEIKIKVSEVLKKFGLEEYYNRKPNEISGGEKQRVAIARALIKDPKIILADEPTGNLDSETSKIILDTLKELSKDKLVIMVTHDREFASIYGDRIIELKDGEIINDYINKIEIVKKHSRLNDIDVMDLKKAKFPFLSSFKFALNSLTLKKIRLLLMLLLFALSLMFTTVASSFSLYDISQATINTFRKYDTDVIPINKFKDESYKTMISFSDKDIDSYIKEFPSINFEKSIFNTNGFFQLPFTPYNNIDSNTFNKITIIDSNEKLYPLEIGNYPLELGEILITDYMAQMILDYNVLDNKDATKEDIIGYKFQESATMPTFTITGIVKTDYYNFYNKLRNQGNFSGIDENFMQVYRQIFMTQNSLDELINKETIVLLKKGDIYSQALLMSHTTEYDDLLIGRLPEKDNELAISVRYLGYYLNEYINLIDVTEEELNQYLNYSLTLNLTAYDKGEQQFKIVGIFNDYSNPIGSVFMFNKSNFDYINYNNPSNAQQYEKIVSLTAFLNDNSSENSKFIKNISNNPKLRHDTLYSNELYSVEETKERTSLITYVMSAVFASFTTIMIFTFITMSIRDKQKEIGTLRALGARNVDIFKIYIIEALFITVISNIIAIIISVFVFKWQNTAVISSFDFNIEVIYINYISILISLVLSLVIITFSTFIPLLRIFKMSPIKSIKNV